MLITYSILFSGSGRSHVITKRTFTSRTIDVFRYLHDWISQSGFSESRLAISERRNELICTVASSYFSFHSPTDNTFGDVSPQSTLLPGTSMLNVAYLDPQNRHPILFCIKNNNKLLIDHLSAAWRFVNTGTSQQPAPAKRKIRRTFLLWLYKVFFHAWKSASVCN